jgi:DNA-binding beta-propeller fold protein YncE
MLSIDGNYIRSTTDFDGLNNPRDVCVNSSNEWIIVSDSDNHRLVVYDINTFQVQRLINDQVHLYFPFGICCDENDLLYVCDRGNNQIVVIRFHDGICVHRWGRKGIEYGEFDAPDYISCRGDILAVSDFNNHRIQVFTLSGQFLFSFGKFGSGNQGEFRYPRGITIDHEGFFMVKFFLFFIIKSIFCFDEVADWMNNRLQVGEKKNDCILISLF